MNKTSFMLRMIVVGVYFRTELLKFTLERNIFNIIKTYSF